MKKPRIVEVADLRKVKAVFFLCLFLLGMPPCMVWAEDLTTEEPIYELEEIVVTATRMKAPRHETADNITVITADDIRKLPVSNAAEALQYIPGLHVEFNGGLGSQATAFIQGSEIRHVAVYQDGVPLNQLANPMTDLSYLPTDAIERIEVFKGAASSAWGSSLGGVINIITKYPDPKKPINAEMRTSYGEHNTFKGRGTFSGTQNNFGCLVSITEDKSDGFMDNTAYRQEGVYAKVQYDPGETSRLDFVYSYDEGRNEDPVILLDDIWDDAYRRRTYQRLLFESSPVDGLDLTFEGHHHHFVSNVEDVDRNDGSRSPYYDYSEESWGVSGRMTHCKNGGNRLNLGLDAEWGEYDYRFPSYAYYEEADCRNRAVYANDTFNLERFSFNVGIRYDHNRDFGSEISPSFGVVYRMGGADGLIRAKIARGFSAPPATWLNSPDYGNKDLKPEVGTNYQLGCELQPFSALKLELNSFWSEIEDLIYIVLVDPATNRYQYENIAEATRRGVEARISATFDFGLSLSLAGSFIDIKDGENNDIKDLPTTLYDVSAIYTCRGVMQSLMGKYVCNNSSYPETRDRIFIFDYLIKGQLPFPARYGKISLFGAVYNVFNSTYVYRDVFPQPDRWFEAGVTIQY